MKPSPAILITGGAGYIGSHTCKALAQAGFTPVAFDNLSNGHRAAVQWGPLEVGDVRDGDAVEAAMLRHQVTAVIHFAGLIEVGDSMVRPDLFWDHNVNGVAGVLSAMQRRGVERLVLSSTAAVYGQPLCEGLAGIREDTVLSPINPYGDSKLAAERMVAAHCRAFGLSAFALRYFNAAGADGDGELGEAHRRETHLIPLAIEAALGLGAPLTVYGTDFSTEDGSCVRDYVHVADLADAHVRAVSADLPAGRFSAINLGTGRGHSVAAVLRAVDRAAGAATPHGVGPRRAGDPAILVADPTRAWDELGWRATRSDLDATVASAIAWRTAPRFGPWSQPIDVAA